MLNFTEKLNTDELLHKIYELKKCKDIIPKDRFTRIKVLLRAEFPHLKNKLSKIRQIGFGKKHCVVNGILLKLKKEKYKEILYIFAGVRRKGWRVINGKSRLV